MIKLKFLLAPGLGALFNYLATEFKFSFSESRLINDLMGVVDKEIEAFKKLCKTHQAEIDAKNPEILTQVNDYLEQEIEIKKLPRNIYNKVAQVNEISPRNLFFLEQISDSE